MNILIIEDDPIWQLKLQMMVEQLNLGTIKTVSSIHDAKREFSIQLPDIILADVVLPDGYAFELFADSLMELPVIFLTGFAEEIHLRKALSMPNVDFLVKPFHMLSLQASIELLSAKVVPKSGSGEAGVWVIGKYKQRIQIPLEKIYWIETQGNYSIIYTHNQKFAVKRSLRKVASSLPIHFIQVQKAFIINSDYIQTFSPLIVQINQQQIPVGRKYRKYLLDVLKEKMK